MSLEIFTPPPGSLTGGTAVTDNAVARFDGASGRRLQNSSVTISDTGDMVISGSLTGTTAIFSGNVTLSNTTASRLVYTDASKNLGSVTTTSPVTFSGSTLSVSSATTSATGVVELATTAEARTGTDTARAVTPEGVAYSIATYKPADAPRPGLISAGTSAAGTTQDNTGLAFGTGDLSIGAWVRLPDWTPAGAEYLVSKLASNVGFQIVPHTTGFLRVFLGTGAGTTTYESTVANGIADGAWAFLAFVLDRDGNLTYYVNGAQLGAPVSIAAQSAQTLTSTAALAWFSNGLGHTAGTFGETFIISGLLTATNIADIYKAGSIAPFSASFTFYQWADFGQGYGPIIKDRSGNNQHALMGTSGLTHAVEKNPPGIPQRASRTAIVGDGSNGSFIRSTLGSQDPGTGDFTVVADVVLNADATNRPVFRVGNSTTAASGQSMYWGTSSGTDGFFGLYGATTSDQRYRSFGGLFAQFNQKRLFFAATRSSSGIKVFIGYEGELFDVTNLSTEGTSGTPPAWTDAVDGDYFTALFNSAASSIAASLYDLRLANVAMTEAQLRTEYERGEPGPEWGGASNTGLVTGDDSTFASDTGFWARAGATISAGVASFPANGNNIQRTSLLVIGRTYRADLTVNSGTLAVGCLSVSGGSTNTSGTGAVSVTFVARDTAFGVQASGGAAEVDSITLTPIGYTSRLRTATAGGLTALNGAKSTTNDSTDFLLSTTGVTTSPDGRRQVIRASTTTNGNQQLFGASVINTTKRWRIVSWNIYTTGTPTISLGSASGGSQYDSATVLTASNNEIALDLRIPASANLWVNSNSTATLAHVVVLEQAE